MQPPRAAFSVAGAATITVNLSEAVGETTTVAYATSDGSATAGSDYTAASGTLSFMAGQTSQTFSVPITNDPLGEANETINLTLSNPSEAILGTPAATTLTILDNDVAATATPTATPTSPPTATPASSTRIKTITFEGGLLDATTGVDSISGVVNLETVAPLKETRSATIPNNATGYLAERFTGTNDLYISRCTSTPPASRPARG
jgi:Calx-beta domain